MATRHETAARTQLMDEYLQAFVKANPGKAKPTLGYDAGWFVMVYAGTEKRYRKSQIEGMRDCLLTRVAGGSTT